MGTLAIKQSKECLPKQWNRDIPVHVRDIVCPLNDVLLPEAPGYEVA